jgi:hypothetical protein
MNWPYLHLTTNHFPIMVTAFGIAILLCAFISRRRATWMFALVTLAVAGFSAGPVFLNGRQAEDPVRDLHVVQHGRINAHEDAAETAIWFMLGMGLLSVYALWRMRRAPQAEQPHVWLRAAVGVASLAAMGTIGYTALMGGKISHGDNALTGKPSIIAAPPRTDSLNARPPAEPEAH